MVAQVMAAVSTQFAWMTASHDRSALPNAAFAPFAHKLDHNFRNAPQNFSSPHRNRSRFLIATAGPSATSATQPVSRSHARVRSAPEAAGDACPFDSL